MEALTVAARLAQFLGAVTLFGTPLFFLYGLPAQGPAAASGLSWPPRVVRAASLALLIGSLLSLVAQTATMSGEASAALDPAAIWSVVSSTQFGAAITVRIGLALLALLLASLMRLGRRSWTSLSLVGAAVVASFAWTGHGAADEGAAGWIHLGADVIHLLAAGVWMGALVALGFLLTSARPSDGTERLQALHQGLEGFSGIGTAVVALLLASGLVNGWFLVGPRELRALVTTAYGLLLLAKVGLFAGMLGLAAANRFQLTPSLGRSLSSAAPEEALRALRRSVALETALGGAVLAVVSLLGVLEPPSAMA